MNDTDLNSTASVLAAVRAYEKADAQAQSGTPTQIRILRNFSAEMLLPYLKLKCFEKKLSPRVEIGNYDNVMQELLAGESAPDYWVISLMLQPLAPDYLDPNWEVSETQNRIAQIFETAIQRVKKPILINTFVPPFYSEFGVLGDQLGKDRVSKVEDLNRWVRDFARKNSGRIYLLDWERMVRALGEAQSMDDRFWYSSKAPFKRPFLARLAADISEVIALNQGQVKKCLILDCDNTLWGGTVGEDGLDGIQLDPNQFPGNCFFEFQKSVLDLVQRGVMVTLCSKNNEKDVLDVLERHPHSVIRKEHLVGWRVNWETKDLNIRSLLKELNIGESSAVFVDDSSIECEWVKKMCPEVTVLQTPKKLEELPTLLTRPGIFSALALTEEDRVRTRQYQENVKREAFSGGVASRDEFLKGLGIEVQIFRPKLEEVARIAQLTHKTNQFNLTTRRYSEAQIQDFLKDQNHSVLGLKVKDRFGDLGIVGVSIAENKSDEIRLDTFLMSCRVIGRDVEHAFLVEALRVAFQTWGSKKCVAQYLPTQKNSLIQNFLETMGFSAEVLSMGRKFYRLERPSDLPSGSEHIRIVTEK